MHFWWRFHFHSPLSAVVAGILIVSKTNGEYWIFHDYNELIMKTSSSSGSCSALFDCIRSRSYRDRRVDTVYGCGLYELFFILLLFSFLRTRVNLTKNYMNLLADICTSSLSSFLTIGGMCFCFLADQETISWLLFLPSHCTIRIMLMAFITSLSL